MCSGTLQLSQTRENQVDFNEKQINRDVEVKEVFRKTVDKIDACFQLGKPRKLEGLVQELVKRVGATKGRAILIYSWTFLAPDTQKDPLGPSCAPCLIGA